MEIRRTVDIRFESDFEGFGLQIPDLKFDTRAGFWAKWRAQTGAQHWRSLLPQICPSTKP